MIDERKLKPNYSFFFNSDFNFLYQRSVDKYFYAMSALLKRVIADLVNYAFASLIFANLPLGNQDGHRCVWILNQDQTPSSQGNFCRSQTLSGFLAAPSTRWLSESVLEDR